jgi:hypothetical protein
LWLAILGLLGSAILIDNHRELWTSSPSSNSTGLNEAQVAEKGLKLLSLGNCIA